MTLRRHRPLFAPPPPPPTQPPRPLWRRALGLFWRWFRRLCAGLGAMVLLSFILLSVYAYRFAGEVSEPLPDAFALYVDLDAPLTEQPADASFAAPLAPPAPTLREVVDAVDAAARDGRVVGLVLRLREGGQAMALAQAGELRAAVGRFRAAGKPTRIYASSWEGGIAPYYLASAFGEIWVQPLGVVSVEGLRAELPFAREALDAIGVTPQMYQRKEYKSAYESLTRKGMSNKSREELTSILEDIGARVGAEVAKARGMEPGAFKALVDQGLFTAAEAAEAGLVTHADYADRMVGAAEAEVACAAKGVAPKDCPAPEGPGDLDPPEGFVWLEDYIADVLPQDEGPGFLPEDGFAREEENHKDGGEPRVALVYITGLITQGGDGGEGTLMGEPVAQATDIGGAILAAAGDGGYSAIVLRVDSPGGSPVASETIARAVEMAQERGGLPVIVSMGSVAASGGYWVSAPADRIFADAATLTGSIGVVGGKVSFGGLWEHLLVRWDGVQWGENAGMWSGNAPFTPAQEARMGVLLDAIYDAFIARVAAGRGIAPEKVEDVARGRVWTGAQALERGLVDELGGLAEALDYAAKQAGAQEGRAGVRVDVFPRPLSALEQFVELLEGGAQAVELQGVLARALVGVDLRGTIAYEPARVR